MYNNMMVMVVEHVERWARDAPSTTPCIHMHPHAHS